MSKIHKTRATKASSKSDWSFKDPNKVVEKVVFTKRGVVLKQKSEVKNNDDFYKSKSWLVLRYRVIRKYGGECMACGRSKKRHGVTIHVDHILPRSKFPFQALRFENLQILCEDCNYGKSNVDKTDWRPEMQFNDDAEMGLVLSAMQAL